MSRLVPDDLRVTMGFEPLGAPTDTDLPHVCPGRIDHDPPGPVALSVVLPFRNAEPYIRVQLEALASQAFDGNWEVVAADDASSDSSRRIVDEYRERLPIRVIELGRRSGAARACNVGARHAAGEKLVFIDADDEIAPGYLAAMADALDRHTFVTSAFDHTTLNPAWVQGAHGPVWRDPANPLPRMFGLLPFAGGSIGISRSAFEKVGGFREEFRHALDVAFSWDVQLAGFDIHYVEAAVYRVRYRQSLKALYRQNLGWGSYQPLLYRRYRKHGMRRRPLSVTARLWMRVLRRTARARSRADLAPVAVQAGLLVGRVRGSLRYRVLYL